MIKIKYNNSPVLVECEFARPSNHIVFIIGSSEVNRSGFIAYDEDGETVLGDYSKFKTVYRTLSNGVQYSDDGSVYKPTTEDLEFTIEVTETETNPFVDEVTINLINFFENTKEIIIKREDGWKHTETLPVEENWRIDSIEEVEGFDGTVYDRTTIRYAWQTPTWAEMMEAQITYTALMTNTLIEEE